MTELSFRPEVFTARPPCLIGARCRECGLSSFPLREACPGCGDPEALESVALETSGSLCSWTVVHNAPADLLTPYILGFVDLPDSRVRVMTRLTGAEAATLRAGMPVELTALPVSSTLREAEPSLTTMMFAFRPSTDPEG